MTRNGSVALAVAAIVALACGDGGDGTQGTDGGIPSGEAGPQGTLTLGEAAYTFSVVTCDPEGLDPNGTTLRGRGTVPDGRRLTVEAERRPPAGPHGRTEHNLFVLFGNLSDGEAWSAKRHQTSAGEWREGELGETAAPGPLVEVSGGRVTARGTLRREGSDQRLEADLRATCAS